MANFLQAHYNRARLAGCSHAIYAVENDLSDKLADELRTAFDKEYPEGGPAEKVQEFDRQMEEEARRAKLSDDLQWHLGTGRYAQ